MRAITASMLVPALAAAAPAGPRPAIEAALTASAAGWNAGDLDRYLAMFAADATFMAQDGLIQGRPAIAARFRPLFAAARDKLTVRVLAIRHISDTHELVFAQYRLTDASGGYKQGPTTLLFERRREGWRVISDHSS